MNARERSALIDALIEGDISEADFLRLEAEFSVDPAARKEYFDRLALSALLETEASAGAGRKIVPLPSVSRRWIPTFAAMAAVLLALAAVGTLFNRESRNARVAAPVSEPKISGFGVLARQVNAVWKDSSPLSDGALLPAGKLQLASGVAQIELFSGVSAVIEGDAEFEIISPMEIAVTRGKLRAHVPEAAHGFRIRTAEGQVVDLGTEFAVDVSASRSEIHVLDGQVEWHPRQQAMQVMNKGEALLWGADGRRAKLAANAAGFVGVAELAAKRDSARDTRRADWQRFSEGMRGDPRLLAYYQMNAADAWSRLLPNVAAARAERVGEGAIVAAARVTDRWGAQAGALDFSPAGSRVRVNVPGELRSITMLAWVKINSLDRLYNSLFLTDGHALGAPHWQVTKDGRLFFSVKKFENRDASRSRRDKFDFYSRPFWDPSLSGQWLLLAVVYDVEARRVTHYLNGAAINSEAIPEEYLVEAVKIGNASIGNWSEPAYRKDAEFAVRNLNGSMDEFALFAAALSAEEIADIYTHGKP